MTKKQNSSVIFAPFFLFLTVILVAVIYFFYNNFSLDNRSNAQEDPICQDKCIGQDRCGNGPPGDTAYNDPCCEELAKTGDPFACGGLERLYCRPEQCAGIPEGVPRQRCGGSRANWCNECKDHNCPGYVANPSPIPPTQVIIPPTQVNIPTIVVVPPSATPFIFPTTAIPTDIPIIPTKKVPTIFSIPTKTMSKPILPVIISTIIPPTFTPTPTAVSFNFPNILPPKEKVQSFWDGVRANLQDFFSKILP